MDFHGTRENGFRYRAECRLAGQMVVSRFVWNLKWPQLPADSILV
jgi:hypothetical protein